MLGIADQIRLDRSEWRARTHTHADSQSVMVSRRKKSRKICAGFCKRPNFPQSPGKLFLTLYPPISCRVITVIRIGYKILLLKSLARSRGNSRSHLLVTKFQTHDWRRKDSILRLFGQTESRGIGRLPKTPSPTQIGQSLGGRQDMGMKVVEPVGIQYRIVKGGPYSVHTLRPASPNRQVTRDPGLQTSITIGARSSLGERGSYLKREKDGSRMTAPPYLLG